MIRVALIDADGIALANHVPGVALCPRRVHRRADVNPVALERAQATGAARPDHVRNRARRQRRRGGDRDAEPAFIAIALAAIATGKHVLCEKPIAMTVPEAREMRRGRVGRHRPHDGVSRIASCRRCAATSLVSSGAGRSCALPCTALPGLGQRDLAWRQLKLGSRHRRARRHALASPRLRAPLNRPVRQDQRSMHRVYDSRIDAAGVSHPPTSTTGSPASARRQGATACREHQGRQRPRRRHRPRPLRNQRHRRQRRYRLGDPHGVQMGRKGGRFERIAVPESFLVEPGSPRDPQAGDPRGLPLRPDQRFLQSISTARRRAVVPRRARGADRDSRDRALGSVGGDRQHRAELGAMRRGTSTAGPGSSLHEIASARPGAPTAVLALDPSCADGPDRALGNCLRLRQPDHAGRRFLSPAGDVRADAAGRAGRRDGRHLAAELPVRRHPVGRLDSRTRKALAARGFQFEQEAGRRPGVPRPAQRQAGPSSSRSSASTA